MSEKKPPKKRRLKLGNVWAEASAIMWHHRKRVLLGLGLMLISRLAGFVLPGSSKYLVDNVFNAENPDAQVLVYIAIAVAVAAIIQGITAFSLSQILSVAAQRAIMDMRKDVQRHVMRLPTSFFDSEKSGVLISRIMTDAEGIRNLVGTGLVQLCGGMVTASIALTVLFYLNWQLTLYTLVVLAVFGTAMATAFSVLRPLFRERGELNAKVTGRLAEALGGIRIVKAYTSERREDIIFANGIHKLFRMVAKSITSVSAITSFASVIIGIIGMLVIMIGGNAIIDESMTLGDFVMYIFFTGMVAAPLVGMANIGTQLSEAFAGLDRIREIRSIATEFEADVDREPLEHVNGDIEFRDVWFEYEEDTPVLKGVSFKAPAGTTTALVGSSGSGKSTLIGLVMAFHYPKRGEVLIDGRDLARMRLKDYREHIGVVMQDNFLFDGTIEENLRYSKPNASMDELKRVAKIAHCDEFIEAFEDGYDTVVGERGVKLSGGQKQRIAIARAILADPQILILDEATSSLDSESEAKIQDGLQSLREGRTTFVIAHRLSTIQTSDQIIVLEHGEIVESGSHHELLDLDGRYKQLYDKQYKFEMNRFVNPGEELAYET